MSREVKNPLRCIDCGACWVEVSEKTSRIRLRCFYWLECWAELWQTLGTSDPLYSRRQIRFYGLTVLDRRYRCAAITVKSARIQIVGDGDEAGPWKNTIGALNRTRQKKKKLQKSKNEQLSTLICGVWKTKWKQTPPATFLIFIYDLLTSAARSSSSSMLFIQTKAGIWSRR